MSHRNQNRKSETISFRLEKDITAYLQREAITEGVSLHEAARQRLLASLSEQPLRDDLEELKEAVASLNTLLRELISYIQQPEDYIDDYD